MNPKEMRRAGRLLNKQTWTDKELVLVIAGLEHAIPYMEEAGGFEHSLFFLRQQYANFLGFQEARKRRIDETLPLPT